MRDDDAIDAIMKAFDSAPIDSEAEREAIRAVLAVVRAHDRDGARLAHLASKLSESALYRMLYPSCVVGSDIDGLRAAIDAAIARGKE